ncbi:hypothetical protein HELRODRAFT_168800 [Helobdella robusta]|uniref:B box-type domain-containing protein n=1 Tax=Helobdella robusta TaxID=6412 RepID=T1F0Z6_HELRO|nr:hypothetical protein HELRODRAFT_168800 [Helobdella robusta]ESO08882.1 hypothetical protein HELRODRAFT_168800 [Helobdella robusta]
MIRSACTENYDDNLCRLDLSSDDKLNSVAVRNKSEISECMSFCELCDENAAVKYCKVCKQLFCLDCLQMHNNIRGNITHDVGPTSWTTQSNVVQHKVCPTHSEDINLYCQQCHVFICSSCLGHDHPLHEFLDINAKIKTEKKELTAQIFLIHSNLEIYSKNLESFSLDEDSEKSRIISELQAKGDKVKQAIDDHVKKLVKSVEEFYESVNEERLTYRRYLEDLSQSCKDRIELLKIAQKSLTVNTFSGPERQVPPIPELFGYESKYSRIHLFYPGTNSRISAPKNLDDAVKTLLRHIGNMTFKCDF